MSSLSQHWVLWAWLRRVGPHCTCYNYLQDSLLLNVPPACLFFFNYARQSAASLATVNLSTPSVKPLDRPSYDQEVRNCFVYSSRGCRASLAYRQTDMPVITWCVQVLRSPKEALLPPCNRGVSDVKNVYVYRMITLRNDCIFSFLW